jgi:hypothetical protein
MQLSHPVRNFGSCRRTSPMENPKASHLCRSCNLEKFREKRWIALGKMPGLKDFYDRFIWAISTLKCGFMTFHVSHFLGPIATNNKSGVIVSWFFISSLQRQGDWTQNYAASLGIPVSLGCDTVQPSITVRHMDTKRHRLHCCMFNSIRCLTHQKSNKHPVLLVGFPEDVEGLIWFPRKKIMENPVDL